MNKYGGRASSELGLQAGEHEALISEANKFAGRSLTPEEHDIWKDIKAALEAKDAEIERLQRERDQWCETASNQDDLLNKYAAENAKLQGIAEDLAKVAHDAEVKVERLRAVLRDFPTIATSTPALIKRIKTEWLPLRAAALDGEQT